MKRQQQQEQQRAGTAQSQVPAARSPERRREAGFGNQTAIIAA